MSLPHTATAAKGQCDCVRSGRCSVRRTASVWHGPRHRPHLQGAPAGLGRSRIPSGSRHPATVHLPHDTVKSPQCPGSRVSHFPDVPSENSV